MKKLKESYKAITDTDGMEKAVYEAETDTGKRIKITASGDAKNEAKIRKKADKFLTEKG